jgi:autotransporter-associated beta strand protein
MQCRTRSAPFSNRRIALSGHFGRRFALSCGVAALLVLGHPESRAATFTWNGASSATNSNWSTGGNWVGGAAPSNPVVATGSVPDAVAFTGTAGTSPVTDQPWFLDNLSVGGGPFNLSGSAITLRPSVDAGHDSRNFLVTSGTQTINNDLKILPALNNTVAPGQNGSGMQISGNLTLNGTLDANGLSGLRLKGSTTTTITINGVITGTINGVAINGGPTVLFNAVNTFTNSFSIYQGTAVLGVDVPATGAGALGNSTSDIILGAGGANGNASLIARPVIPGTTVTIGRGIALSTPTNTNQPVYTIGGDAANVGNYTGPVYNGTASAAARALSVTAAIGGRVNFEGAIQRRSTATGSTDDLSKIGQGIVALNALNNSWAGNTNVTAGTLLVNGSISSTAVNSATVGAVNVSASATLGGAGTIGRDTVVANLGIFAPGNVSAAGVDQAGKLTLGSGLTLNQTSALRFDLGAPAGTNDEAAVTGAFTLDGVLNVTSLAGFGVGSYRLFQYASTFTDNGLQFGTMPAGFSYDYSVHDGGVYLNVVPEPTTAGLFGLGAGLALLRRRRR